MKTFTITETNIHSLTPTIDQITGDVLRVGDNIVVCRGCMGVSTQKSWDNNGHMCPNCQSTQLAEIEDVIDKITIKPISVTDKSVSSNNADKAVRQARSLHDIFVEYKGAIITAGVVLLILLLCAAISSGVRHRKAQQSVLPAGYVETTSEEETTAYVEPQTQAPTEPPVNYISIPKKASKTLTADDVTVVKHSGTFSDDEDEHKYTFVANRSGRHYIEFYEIMADVKLDVFVYNSLGETISSQYYCGNGEGITLDYLKKDKTYTIAIKPAKGLGDYHFKIYRPKKTYNINNITTVYDSIEHSDQLNKYSFTPSVGGMYSFELTEIYDENYFDVTIKNHLNEVVETSYCVKNNENVQLYLDAGEKYNIIVEQSKGTSTYTMLVNYPSEKTEVTDNCVISDEIHFEGQRNRYILNCSDSEPHTVTLEEFNDGNVDVYVYNEFNENVSTIYCVENGESFKVSDKYMFVVRYNKGYSTYKLSID